MKHIMGNTPKCWECRHFQEMEKSQKLYLDGWCYEPKAQGVNGKMPKHPSERAAVHHNWNGCRWWIDAESGHTRYEVLTGAYKQNPVEGVNND